MKKYKIDVFIPVGGIGKRLGGITNNIPKPLIKINNGIEKTVEYYVQ